MWTLGDPRTGRTPGCCRCGCVRVVYLVLYYRRDGMTGLFVGAAIPRREPARERGRSPPLRAAVHGGPPGHPNWETRRPRFRLGYNSMVTPSVYDYDLATGGLTLLRAAGAARRRPAADYEQLREWAVAATARGCRSRWSARPGTPTGRRRRDLRIRQLRDSGPWFSSPAVAAGPGLRVRHRARPGRRRDGPAWYDNGKLLSKRNTFTDFVACARQLVDGRAGRAATGWWPGAAAGGLLMGAVANLAPRVSPGSWRRCRSSTRSTRYWTRRCR